MKYFSLFKENQEMSKSTRNSPKGKLFSLFAKGFSQRAPKLS